ncbi:MAG: hypothetical protein JSR26_05185 [Proteobacteria bacterium]|nr:hypothetical protein [Pseudomonadota bacterium]
MEELAGVTKASQLDLDHRLNKGLLPGPRFTQIRADGYDPATVDAKPDQKLLEHARAIRHFKPACDDYDHALWANLLRRAPSCNESDDWLRSQLDQRGIIYFDSEDERHAVELGLVPEVDDSGEEPLQVYLSPARYASLDGLRVLLLLYRQAQDAVFPLVCASLKKTLEEAARLFAKAHGYHGEQNETWELLIASRMVAWRPEVIPSPAQVSQARASLLAEWEQARPGHRKPADPRTLKKNSRSERRWRRRIHVRACLLHVSDSDSYFAPLHRYRNACELYEWLKEHRLEISSHLQEAVYELIQDEASEDAAALSPLEMPESLYGRRRRKQPHQAEIDLFGDRLPFDLIRVIPVEPE